ncbi:MAG: hypothetical protein DHS20C13_17480 [Thermodesulfobacteriota bacterium]|nr:MAG: hypothetical protein DHS20C13_17480 [Thermodesulfobacteriota bacterium]
MNDMKDVFICHAGEDKEEVVRPLCKALEDNSISYWVDEGEIRWGHSLTGKVSEGLAKSKYVIVVLSNTFVTKSWPKLELEASLNMEASSGDIKVLPLIVGDQSTKDVIFEKYPLLNHKRYIIWSGETSFVIDELKKVLNLFIEDVAEKENGGNKRNIRIPRIKKDYTQLERDRFIEGAFLEIKNYFKEAMSILGKEYDEIDTNFSEISEYEFVNKIYLNGDLKCGSKIWISSPNLIGYVEGASFRTGTSEAFNEMIHLNDESDELSLKFGIGNFGIIRDKAMTPLETAESLWERFTIKLES